MMCQSFPQAAVASAILRTTRPAVMLPVLEMIPGWPLGGLQRKTTTRSLLGGQFGTIGQWKTRRWTRRWTRACMQLCLQLGAPFKTRANNELSTISRVPPSSSSDGRMSPAGLGIPRRLDPSAGCSPASSDVRQPVYFCPAAFLQQAHSFPPLPAPICRFFRTSSLCSCFLTPVPIAAMSYFCHWPGVLLSCIGVS